ncbi:hypothetical protein NFI96_005869 [Prochilodus magdalenae]|nr:hypothetical protein NFI96_005869 [Prochilodus magdalenae]
MSLEESTDALSLLHNEEEAVAVETAVRAAVMSIMKVLLDVSDRRAKSYQLKLAEVERENLQLRLKLKAAERLLQSGQRSASSGGSYELSADLTFSPESSQSLSTAVVEGEEEEEEEEAAAGFPQTVSEQEACLQASGCRLYKEEPTYGAYEDTFWIKNEMAEEEKSAVDFEYHVLAHVGRTGGGQPQQQTVPVERCGACNSFNHSVQEDAAVLTSLERSMERSLSISAHPTM